MTTVSYPCHAVAWIALTGLCAPSQAAHAGNDLPSATTKAAADQQCVIRDIALAPRGLITGQVLDANRRPVPHAEVAIVVADATVAVTRTDANGVFAITGLRGGVHQVFAPQASEVCRLWAPGTAPPSAVPNLRICAAHTIIRGQNSHQPLSHIKSIATHPLVVGGLLAAAVAIPVSLNNDDEPPGS